MRKWGQTCCCQRATLVGNVDEQASVVVDKRSGEGHVLAAIWEQELGAVPQSSREGRRVVPDAGVEPDRVVADRVQDLLHLKGAGDVFDQNADLRAAERKSKFRFSACDDPVLPLTARQRAAGWNELMFAESNVPIPDESVLVRLDLRQVEERPDAVPMQQLGVVEHVHGEIEEPAWKRLTPDSAMLLLHVPGARPNHEQGALGPGGSCWERRREDVSARIVDVQVAQQHVAPRGAATVVEVDLYALSPQPIPVSNSLISVTHGAQTTRWEQGLAYRGARVQRFEQTVSVAWRHVADVHAPVEHALREGINLPVCVSDVRRVSAEVERRVVLHLRLQQRALPVQLFNLSRLSETKDAD